MRRVFGYLNKPADAVGCLQVIVVEDENGNIVRETMKDNDVLQQYKTMRETLVGAAAVHNSSVCRKGSARGCA